MARDLAIYSRVLFFFMLALIVLPVFGALFSSGIASRVHETESVIIAAFGALGTLVGWLKTIEQWAENKKGDQ